MPKENFWTLWCKSRLTEADTLTIRLGSTPSELTSSHLSGAGLPRLSWKKRPLNACSSSCCSSVPKLCKFIAHHFCYYDCFMTAMKSGMHVSLLVSIHFYCLYHIFIIVFVCLSTFSALTLLVWRQEGRLACKKWDGGGGHWLIRMEWCPAGWSVFLPLLIFPCTIKSRSSLLASAHPGRPGKGP